MKISGSVVDSMGTPLMGVNVFPLKDGSSYGKGGITDYDGNFNIEIEDLTSDQIVKFSYLGFTPVEISAGQLKNKKITMNEMFETLDTVVITATKPKSVKDVHQIAQSVQIAVMVGGLALAGWIIYNLKTNG